MNIAQEGWESKSWNFVESCGRTSPWCTPILVTIGTHLVHFWKSRRQNSSIKSTKNSKIVNEMSTAQERRESKSWNFVESCGRTSPWCTPILVTIGTHLVHFWKSRRQNSSIKSTKNSKIGNGAEKMGDRAGTGVQNLGGTTWRVKKKFWWELSYPLHIFPTTTLIIFPCLWVEILFLKTRVARAVW